MTSSPPSDSVVRLEKFRAALLSAELGRKEKLVILKTLTGVRREPRVAVILQDAAAAPCNEGLLKFIVRSFGYLELPDIIDRLVPFLKSGTSSVVTNALKALAAQDKGRAVELGMPLVKTAPTDIAAASAKVLAQRCRAEALAAAGDLAASSRSSDRVAAILWVRYFRAEDAIPLLTRMMRIETNPDLLPLQLKLVSRIVSKSQSAPLGDLVAELRSKADQLAGILGTLGDTPESAKLSVEVPTGQFLTTELGASAELGRPGDDDDEGADDLDLPGPSTIPPRTSPALPTMPEEALPRPTSQRAGGRPTGTAPTAPPVAESRSDEGTVPAAVEDPEPGGLLSSLPWMRKLRHKRATVTVPADGTAPVDAPSAPAHPLTPFKPLAGLVGVAYLAFLTLNRAPPVSERRMVTERTECALGTVGSRIEVRGELREIHRDYNIIVLKGDKDVVVSAYFLDTTVSGLTVGKAVIVQGVLKEIKSEKVVVVQGQAVRQV